MPLSVSIKKKMGNFTLDVNFEGGDEVLALLGASGCGKSMTLKCIAGVETPDEGRIVLDDKILFDSYKKINLPPQKRRIGYLFQNYALFPNMTVYQNIASGVLRKDDKQKIVREQIKAFHLEGHEDKYPSQISGGQQQRVALARILANEPEILMLDEPFAALDSYLRRQLERELALQLQNYPKTTLFVSHNRGEVYRLCQKVCLMKNGKSLPVVPVEELIANPGMVSSVLLPSDSVEIYSDTNKEENIMFSAAVITVSDRGFSGQREDAAGPLVADLLTEGGFDVVFTEIVPDEQPEIEKALINASDNKDIPLIVTTGGTGFAPRDVTPEATQAVCRRMVPGIPEAMRTESMKVTNRAMLSRMAAGIRGGSLIVNLPGSPKAAKENLLAVLPSLEHGLEMLRGTKGDCAG